MRILLLSIWKLKAARLGSGTCPVPLVPARGEGLGPFATWQMGLRPAWLRKLVPCRKLSGEAIRKACKKWLASQEPLHSE